MNKIGVIGAGTWGIALARLLSNKGHEVTVWSALPDEIEHLKSERVHPNLPGVIIPEAIIFTTDDHEVCADKDLLLFAVPSVYVRKTTARFRDHIPVGQLIVDAAKGIEQDTLMTMTEVISDGLGKAVRMVALSGPTHAEEVSRDLLTAIVAASKDESAAREVQEVFSTPSFRVYTNPDIRGVELCGAIKNVIALAAGICDGLGQGDNARAALITRGLAELQRLGRAMGCEEASFRA